MKYIDTEKLIAEIESRKEKWLLASRLVRKGKDKAMYAAGKSSAYTEFLSLVTSLQREQPEVELEKAARNVYESWMGGSMDDVRRDMVELGKVLNARKED